MKLYLLYFSDVNFPLRIVNKDVLTKCAAVKLIGKVVQSATDLWLFVPIASSIYSFFLLFDCPLLKSICKEESSIRLFDSIWFELAISWHWVVHGVSTSFARIQRKVSEIFSSIQVDEQR